MIIGCNLAAVLKVEKNRIFVRFIQICIFPVDFSRRFTHQGLSRACVVKFQGFGQIVFQRIIPRPLPRLHDLRVNEQIGLNTQKRLCVIAHAAGFINSVHLRPDGELLWE